MKDFLLRIAQRLPDDWRSWLSTQVLAIAIGHADRADARARRLIAVAVAIAISPIAKEGDDVIR
jgi:hypothetical protein